MYTKILNFIMRMVTEYFPDIAFREGTASYDLFVKAYALLHSDNLDTQDIVLSRLDPREYENMSDVAMDRLAANWFVSRAQGSLASGTVRIYFSSPSDFYVPSGFEVSTASGLTFSTYTAFSYSASQITSQREGSRYYCDIQVQARGYGDQYNVGAGAISDIVSPLYLPWTGVTNLSPFVGGAARETNEQLYSRIINSVNTRSLLITKGSASSSILENFPTVIEVDTVGFGDDAMLRDIVYGLVMPNHIPYRKEDFYLKSKGSNLYNRNVAYYLSREFDTDPGGDPVPDPLSEIEADAEEVSQDQYDGLAMLDLVYASNNGGIAYSETFDNDTGFSVYEFPDAHASDSGFPFGQRRYGNSIYISTEGKLVMGAQPTALDAV